MKERIKIVFFFVKRITVGRINNSSNITRRLHGIKYKSNAFFGMKVRR